jgi:16S rRNA (cytidine1402-2'-O)-methyltransferase
LPTDSFLFGGFLPAKTGQRKTALNEYKTATETLVFYEAPHRILETVVDMVEIFGQQRQGFLAREISKAFETFLQGTLEQLQQQISLDSNQQRGEIVLVIAGAEEKTAGATVSAEKVLKLLLKELPASKAASLTAKICGADKKAMYQSALQLQGK